MASVRTEENSENFIHRSNSLPVHIYENQTGNGKIQFEKLNGHPITRSQSLPDPLCSTVVKYDGRSALDIVFNRPSSFQESDNSPKSSPGKAMRSRDDVGEDNLGVPTNVTPDNVDTFTFYQLFGIPSPDAFDIKYLRKVYHKACLVYHPDKRKSVSKDADGVEDNRVFLKLQEGFNVLSDDDKRRVYDSQLPFDESTPTEAFLDKKMKKNPKSFYTIFDPVFKRNGRFAVKKPIPNIGDDNTPIEEVLRFYEYWVNFESWRDFSGKDSEYNPDDATSREEKRWMQKENEKIGKKLKKKEMDRIIDFVTLAQRKDPRIIADKEARRQAKEAEKFAKEAEERKKAEEAAAAIAAAEQAELEAKEAATASKADREKMKKIMSKARNILRKLLRHTAVIGLGDGAYGILTDEEQEFLCANSSLEELNLMNDAMGSEQATKDPAVFISEGAEIVKNLLIELKDRKNRELEEEKRAKEAKKVVAADKTNDPKAEIAREWSRDHLSMLAKGVAKFPAGQTNRWGLITQFMNDSVRPSIPYSQDECVKAAFNAAKNVQVGKKK